MVSQDMPDWTRFNPIALWRDWVVRSEEQWSSAFTQLMKDERAGGVLNRQADEMRMMHRMFSEMAQASLAAANLPSRTDLEALDVPCTCLEVRDERDVRWAARLRRLLTEHPVDVLHAQSPSPAGVARLLYPAPEPR
mgnify:CR=1 FL=1